MANTPLLGPTLDQQNELLRAWVQAPALRDEGRVAQRRGAIDGQVKGDVVLQAAGAGGREQGDLRFLAAEGGAAELETETGSDEDVRASANGRLLQLAAVELPITTSASSPSSATAASASGVSWYGNELRGTDSDDEVHLRHRHAASPATGDLPAGEGRDLGPGEGPAERLLHNLRQAPHGAVTLRRRAEASEKLLDLTVPALRCEAWGEHWLATVFPKVLAGRRSGSRGAPRIRLQVGFHRCSVARHLVAKLAAFRTRLSREPLALRTPVGRWHSKCLNGRVGKSPNKHEYKLGEIEGRRDDEQRHNKKGEGAPVELAVTSLAEEIEAEGERHRISRPRDLVRGRCRYRKADEVCLKRERKATRGGRSAGR
mmetsp:Transcript_50450/g.127143  ORF Transcript_50450/g.127143 Transcript_50450/m.127143 type:complete len:372 (+) Transcript_50450:725-1840(+)